MHVNCKKLNLKTKLIVFRTLRTITVTHLTEFTGLCLLLSCSQYVCHFILYDWTFSLVTLLRLACLSCYLAKAGLSLLLPC